MRHLPRHVGPGLEALRALTLAALPFQVLGHAVEIANQPAELVRGGRHDVCVEIAAGDPPGRARESIDWIADALGHPVAKRRAQEAEEHRRQQQLMIEIVELPVGILSA